MMTTPLPAEIVRAPFFLRDLPIWLVWRYAQSAGSKKPLKVPYYVNGDTRHYIHGSPEDTRRLVDFSTAKSYAITHGFTGVGLALLPGYGITALDFDNCIDDNGVVNHRVEACVVGLYSEVSPSGKGIRSFVMGDHGDHKSPTIGDQFGFETFNHKGFVTFTGNLTELCQLADTHDEIALPNTLLSSLILARFGRNTPTSAQSPDTLGLSQDQLVALLNYHDPNCGYLDWLHVGMALHHETEGSDEGFFLWDSWSTNSGKYNTQEYNRSKWDSFGGSSSQVITARTLVKQANSLGAHIHSGAPLISVDDFLPIQDDPPTSGEVTLKNYYHIRSAADFIAQVKPITWLIKGVLPKATLGVFYGESGSGKSFAALDICASIGRQVAWHGIRPKAPPRRVLYIVAEGVGGFAHRLTAYCHQAGIRADDLPIDIISEAPPNLMDQASVEFLIRDIHALGPYDLIVMDTFAQVTAGANENSGEDMGRALGYCRKISSSTNAMVLLVHHSGKDASKGARGWSGVHAAADVVLEVTRFDEQRCITITKQKDGIEGAQYGFNLIPIVIGQDEDGDDITSCIVHHCDFTKPITKERKKLVKGQMQTAILAILEDYEITNWVPENNLIELILDNLPDDQKRKGNVQRALKTMEKIILEKNEQNEWRLLPENH